MAERPKFTSPTLNLRITPELYERAVQSDSGGCLIADAIKEQYPHLTSVTVDMTTVRVSDRKKGLRYVYFTPPPAQHVLLAFDQGWPNPTDEVVLRRAVKITPIVRSKPSEEKKAQRKAELEAKVARGEQLTPIEKRSLTKMARTPARPNKTGPAVMDSRSRVIHGGPHLVTNSNPNLLRGRDRHFGAKLAEPGIAFRDAVEKAVAERLSETLPEVDES